MGGEHAGSPIVDSVYFGSSPHGRGTPLDVVDMSRVERVIPAWAGNTSAFSNEKCAPTGHPRMGGEHSSSTSSLSGSCGSSPHGRGTLRLGGDLKRKVRVIPAWAGNTHGGFGFHSSSPGHPRMGGEHVVDTSRSMWAIGSSPHGRGTRRGYLAQHVGNRVIPAWAGNTASAPTGREPTSGHPRMGGEHGVVNDPGTLHGGSSPHGRGTPARPRTAAPGRRVIPAWAGNTRTVM